MVDTDGMNFGSRVLDAQARVLDQQGYLSKHKLSTSTARTYTINMVEKITRLHIGFLVNQNLSLENIQTLELPMIQIKYQQALQQFFTYMMHKSKHYLLGNSKQLTSIKLLKTVIYKTYVSILYHYHMHSIFRSNQTPINLFEQLSKQI